MKALRALYNGMVMPHQDKLDKAFEQLDKVIDEIIDQHEDVIEIHGIEKPNTSDNISK